MNEHAAPNKLKTFQARVYDWMLYTFSAEATKDATERCHRLLEETLELVQSLGCTASEAHQLIDYVFGRPVGEPAQELGGTQLCLAGLAHAAGLDLEVESEKELARNWQNAEKIRAKWKMKPKFSPLPQPVDVVTIPKGPQDKVDEIIRPYLEMIRETPELMSLLYDIDMLPEQTVTIIGAIRLAGLCKVWKRMSTLAKVALDNAIECAKLHMDNELMRPVVEAGDDLYASLVERDNRSKFQEESLATYAQVRNAYRGPQLKRQDRPEEPTPYKVPHIVINEEAHGHE
jgi:hypothetical protein